MNSPLKFQILLTDEQRHHLEQQARDGNSTARKARYARLLLHADQAHPEGCRSDAWIADALGMHPNTVARVRKDFVAGGADAAFVRKPRQSPPIPPKIDGRVEAHLVATCCSPPPEGRARWTLQLRVDDLVGQGLVTSISVEAVRRTLKKTNCSPGASRPGVSPSETGPGSSPRWKKCSTSTPPPTAPKNH